MILKVSTKPAGRGRVHDVILDGRATGIGEPIQTIVVRGEVGHGTHGPDRGKAIRLSFDVERDATTLRALRRLIDSALGPDTTTRHAVTFPDGGQPRATATVVRSWCSCSPGNVCSRCTDG